MTGISLSILVGQIGRFTGVKIESDGLFRPLFEIAAKASLIHWPSLALGVGLFVLLRVTGRMAPCHTRARWSPWGWPLRCRQPLIFRDWEFALWVRYRPQLPSPMLPIPQGIAISDLILGAAAVLIVSFGAGIVTARSFGAKNKYPVDANRELLGFGAANVASGLFGGFAVTASDSRTAINDLMGGKTQLAGIVSAIALALAVLFLVRRVVSPAHASARRRPCFRRHQPHRFADPARIVADQPDRVRLCPDQHRGRARPRRPERRHRRGGRYIALPSHERHEAPRRHARPHSRARGLLQASPLSGTRSRSPGWPSTSCKAVCCSSMRTTSKAGSRTSSRNCLRAPSGSSSMQARPRRSTARPRPCSTTCAPLSRSEA